MEMLEWDIDFGEVFFFSMMNLVLLFVIFGLIIYLFRV